MNIFQITDSNDTVTELMRRVEDIEVRLRSPQLVAEKRKILEQEVCEIRKLLQTNRTLLKQLHNENSKTFALTACLVFVCFLVYGCYVMIYGT